jgi:hypothetical protein
LKRFLNYIAEFAKPVRWRASGRRSNCTPLTSHLTDFLLRWCGIPTLQSAP